MEYKKISLESDFEFTDIQSANERLFLFQLDKKALLYMRDLISLESSFDNFIFKETKIIRSLSELSQQQKSDYIDLVLKYVEFLNNISLDDEYYYARKYIANKLKECSIHRAIFSSTLSRLAESYLYSAFKKSTTNKEDLFNETLIINNFFKFEQEIIYKFYEEKINNILLEQLNSTIEEMTKLDFYPKMNTKITSIIEFSKSINNSSKNISTMTRENTNSLERFSSSTNVLSKVIDENKTNIEFAIGDIFSINNDFRKTEATINDLVMNIRTINNIINEIKTISEQTTLLAINASIEASRAEAEGKGFSVIAEEIRNLSEQTTISVERITNIIQKFEENTYRLDKNTKDVIGRLNQKSKKTESAFGYIETIFDSADFILKNISSLTNDFKKIESEIDLLKNVSEEVFSGSGDLQVILKNLNKEIFDTTKSLIVTKTNVEQDLSNIRHTEMLKFLSINSKNLFWDLYNYISGFNNELVSIKDYNDYFEKYYQTLKNNNAFENTNMILDLKKKHEDMVFLFEKIVFMYEKDNLELVELEMITFKNTISEFNVALDVLGSIL